MKKVQVANQQTNYPLPGILIPTDLGDVLVVLEPATRTLGMHAPGDMIMNDLVDLVSGIINHYREKEEDPFAEDDTADLVFENSFIWYTYEG